MSEYIVSGAKPNNTVLKSTTANGYEHESWLPVLEEIVRCMDCKWLRVDMSDHEYRSGYWCDMGRFDPKPDGFCAWGERRED